MEINGFEVDIFNQHKFTEGSKSSICTFCSHNRKKKSDKCVSLDWDRGFFFCNHCGESGQLHTYKKKESIKNYVKPPFKYDKMTNNAFKWFLERGVSKQTLSRLKVTCGIEWMPQTKKEMNTINFNYFLNEQLVNVKYRDGKKNFKLFKDAEKIFYNLDSIRTSKECVIVEGEIDCLSFVEAEIFNVVSIPNGFNLQGNINLDYLDNYLDFFDNKEKIYLALDNDEAGIKGQKEFIRRLGSERCYIVNFKDCKDANEYLIKYGKEELSIVIDKAELTPLENVKVLNDYSKDLDSFWINGLPKGMLTGLSQFDDIFSAELGQYTLVTGVPQCFTKDQKVVTNKGSKEISLLNEGDLVLSYNHDKGINEFRKVVNTMVNKNTPDKIYKITMKDGSIIKCTENHRFFNGVSYVKIKELLLNLNKFKNL